MATPSPTPEPMGVHSATPGPWSFRYYMEPVGKNGDNFHLFDGPEGDQGGTILEGAFVFQGNHSQALVYARLIAAAPDLYEALKHIVDGALSLPCFAEEEARAALSKAGSQS